MLHNLSNAKAQKLSFCGRRMEQWAKWSGPIMAVVSGYFSIKAILVNKDNPVKLRRAFRDAIVNSVDTSVATLAVFASPGIGQAVGVVYITWGAWCHGVVAWGKPARR